MNRFLALECKLRVICVWNCEFYKRAQSNEPLNVSLWFWVVKLIIWMLVLEILLKYKKSLIVLATTLSLTLFRLRIFAYRLSQFSLSSFFYRFTKYYMHSRRLLCIFLIVLSSSKGCLWPECQMGVHRALPTSKEQESFHGVTLACIGLLCGRVYINLICRIIYLAASDSW